MKKIKSFNTNEDFKQCILQNVGIESEYCYTTNKEGYIETMPIFLGDLDNIKRVIFKINNINFDNMKHFTVTVSVSEKQNGIFIDTGTVTNNIFHLNKSYYFLSFLKLYQLFLYHYLD